MILFLTVLLWQVELSCNMETEVNFTYTKKIFHASVIHWSSLHYHSNHLESSCSALIPLCFLMHWPGMWCYFITESEATSSVSSPRALATHSLTGALYVIITEWLCQTSSVAYGKSKSSREKLWSQEKGQAHTSVKEAWKAWTAKTETSTALKTCHQQWTQTTMNLVSSLSFSEYCAVVFCACFTIQSDLITDFRTVISLRLSAVMVAFVKIPIM